MNKVDKFLVRALVAAAVGLALMALFIYLTSNTAGAGTFGQGFKVTS